MNVTKSLDAMFNPQSITIIGASGQKGKINSLPLNNLKKGGYQGEVYPVNPKYQEIAGYNCFESIEDLPLGIDLAIVSVGATHVLTVLERLEQREIKSAVVFSSGFSEVGENGAGLQKELLNFCKTSGIPICGPNSLGLYNRNKGVTATFAALEFDLYDEVAFVTQSGAFGSFTYELAKDMGYGYNYFVSTGNEAGTDFFDYVAHFAKLDEVKVIGGYIEGARDFNKMEEAIDLAHKKDKPLVLMKVGNSKIGAEAAKSHTSSLAGNQSVYDSYFKQKNVIQVEDEEELIDTLAIFNKVKKAPNRGGLGVVTVSGGTGIVMADKCEEFKVPLAELTTETTRKLKELLPTYASVKNPIDVTAQIMQFLDKLEDILMTLLEDENIEAVIFYMQIGHQFSTKITSELAKVSKRTNKTIIICWSGASEQTKEALFKEGICWIPTPTRAVKAVGNFLTYNKNKGESSYDNQQQLLKEPKRINKSETIKGVISEFEGKQILTKYDIAFPKGILAQSEREAVNFAEKIGYPIVLKTVSKDIMHKSDIGGVITNINSQDELMKGYKEIIFNSFNYDSNIDFEGVLVEEMSDEGIEAFVGCFQDPLFGPCIMFGLGGIYIEVLSDIAIRRAPLTRKDAEDMVKSIKAYSILKGIRGQKPTDINALITTLVNVSRFCWDYKEDIIELDINPLLVKSEGEGVVGLDALIVGES